MTERATVEKWLDENPALVAAYAEARSVSVDDTRGIILDVAPLMDFDNEADFLAVLNLRPRPTR